MGRLVMAVAALAFGLAGVAAWTTPVKSTAGPATPVERGRYLVTSIGCGDCHTPKTMGANGPEEDHSRLLSGHPRGRTSPRRRRWARAPGSPPHPGT